MVHVSLKKLQIGFALALVAVHAYADEATLWQAMRKPGHVVLIRHSTAPGTGDPSQFKIDDCATQRNLSEAGREEARRIGERFRHNGIRRAEVHSSRWCRCIDTARLLGLGPVEALPLLDSFFARPERGQDQTRRLLLWLQQHAKTETLVLVTHQVNITTLTGLYPAPGDIVVVAVSSSGSIRVAGTIAQQQTRLNDTASPQPK